MKVILFGATGMVGQGALRECLLDPEVEAVLSISRSPSGQEHPKLRERITANPTDLSPIEAEVAGYDACLFCLGVSSSGMTEEAYRRVTQDMTLEAARTLVKVNPGMTFIFVSGGGTDSTGTSRMMWARVKGATENALLEMPFKGKYMFRPGFIQPLHGITSRTASYRVLYAIIRPLVPLIRWMFPETTTTTERLGQAMLKAAKQGAPKAILETRDINALVPEPA